MKKNIVLIASACLALCACDRGDKHKTANMVDNEIQSDSLVIVSGDESLSEADRQLLQRIRATLRDDNMLNRPARMVQLKISNGEVTIRGIVNTRQEKDALANRIAQIAGVRALRNHIELSGRETSYASQVANAATTNARTPTGMNANDKFATNKDRTILQSIRDALANDATLAPDARSINIKVENSIVTLTGTAPSEKQKTLITAKIKRVSGVTNVDNQLKTFSSMPSTAPNKNPNRGYGYGTQKNNNKQIFNPNTAYQPRYNTYEQGYNYPRNH